MLTADSARCRRFLVDWLLTVEISAGVLTADDKDKVAGSIPDLILPGGGGMF